MCLIIIASKFIGYVKSHSLKDKEFMKVNIF